MALTDDHSVIAGSTFPRRFARSNLARHGQPLTAALLALAAVACEPSVVIGGDDLPSELPPLSASSAPFPCMEPTRPGPSKLQWCRVAEGGSQCAWSPEPSEDAVGVDVSSPAYLWAGLAFQFDAAGHVASLADYDTLALDLTLHEAPSKPLELVLSTGRDRGCLYPITPDATGTVLVDLHNPYWCWPSQCGWDVQASGGALRLPYSDGGAARFELSSVALQRRAGGTSNVNGLGASLGPSGLCWFTYGWQDALAGWLTPPTPTLASARALSTAAGAAGMAFEVSGAPADWSALHHLTLQGSFPVDLAFVVQAVTAETPRGCTWNLRGQGTGNYVVELQAPDSCWGTPTFDLRGVSRVEIQVQSGVSAELQVSSVALD